MYYQIHFLFSCKPLIIHELIFQMLLLLSIVETFSAIPNLHKNLFKLFILFLRHLNRALILRLCTDDWHTVTGHQKNEN